MSTSAHTQKPTESISVTSEGDERTLTAQVSGEVDVVTSPWLEQELTRMLDAKPETLVVDITQVAFLASAGLAALLKMHQQAGEHTSFRVVADGAATLRPIQLMGLDKEFPVYTSVAEAVAVAGER